MGQPPAERILVECADPGCDEVGKIPLAPCRGCGSEELEVTVLGRDERMSRTEVEVLIRRIRHGLKDTAGSMDARKALRDLGDRWDLDVHLDAP